MSTGAGTAAAGVSPAGTGDVDVAPAPDTTLLVDPDTGIPSDARRIDPVTRQYVLSATGAFLGMPRVRQLVQIRIQTVLNSSAVQGLGLERETGDMDQFALRRLELKLRAALDDLVVRKLVAILSVEASSDLPTRKRGRLRWKDLTTGEEYREDL